MSIFPLVIGPDEQSSIASLIAKAEANRLSYDQLLLAQNRRGPLPIMRDLTIRVPISYTVSFSIEELVKAVDFRHVSVGLKTSSGRCPSQIAVSMVINEFGFKNFLQNCKFWEEPLCDGTFAINVIEPLTGDWASVEKALRASAS